jgi:hypothetical protein
MTTRNVSTSCDVLWVSRTIDNQVAALLDDKQRPAVNIRDVTQRLVQAGAHWLSSDSLESERSALALYPNGSAYSDIVQASWSKDTSSPAGVFTAQLVPRLPFDEIIAPGDLLVIFMDNDHRFFESEREHGTLITFAIVDRVSASTSAGGAGETTDTYSLTSRDLGVIFQKTETVWDKAFAQIDQLYFDAAYVKRISDIGAASLGPSESVLTLLDLIFNQNATNSTIVGAQWSFPRGTNGSGRPLSLLSLLDVSSYVQTPMFGFTLANSPGIVQAGNAWSLLEGYANRVVNEFFVDVRDRESQDEELYDHLESIAASFCSPGDVLRQNALKKHLAQSGAFNRSVLNTIDTDRAPVMALIHRQLPYDHDAFMRLPVVDLDHTEVFDVETATSSHDVANFFKIRFPDLEEAAQELIYGVKLNIDSIRRHGVCRMEVESRFMFTTSLLGDAYANGTGIPVFGDVFDYYIELLSTWYAANDFLRAGSIACRYRPDIRCGTRLRYQSVRGVELNYYIQGVNHTFGRGEGQSQSMLTVVRGFQSGLGGVANNLFWGGKAGNRIPPNLAKFITINPLRGD